MPRAFSACAAIALLSTVTSALAANDGALRHATADSTLRIQSEAKAKAAELRREWLAAGHVPPPAIDPAITGGKVLTPKINVASVPAAPVISVSYNTGKAGFCSISLYFYAPHSEQELSVYYNRYNKAPPLTKGTLSIQYVGSGGYGSGEFNGYSEPGTWTLSYGYIYDCAGNYKYYSTADFASLFDTTTVLVVNNLKPDVTPPLITGANVLTPKVSLSTDPPDFAARLVFSDDISGVRYTWVEMCPPSGSGGNCFDDTNYLSAPQLSGSQKDYNYFGDQTITGQWSIAGFGICDVARNCMSDYDATDIKALFGTTTVKVTQ